MHPNIFQNVPNCSKHVPTFPDSFQCLFSHVQQVSNASATIPHVSKLPIISSILPDIPQNFSKLFKSCNAIPRVMPTDQVTNSSKLEHNPMNGLIDMCLNNQFLGMLTTMKTYRRLRPQNLARNLNRWLKRPNCCV